MIDCRALSVTDGVFRRRLDGDAVAQRALRSRVGVIISPTIAEFGMAGQPEPLEDLRLTTQRNAESPGAGPRTAN